MDRTHYYLDKFALNNEILSDFNLPKSIKINECTLREVDQVVSFSPDEKMEIAYKLAELGINQIQAGVPGVSKSDFQFIKRLKRENFHIPLQTVAFVYSRDWKEQIDACLECEADSIHLFYTVSDEKLKIKGISREEMFEESVGIIRYAREQGAPYIAYCPFPAVRTDLDVLIKIINDADHEGAEEILITDTYGTCNPASMKWLFKKLYEKSEIKLGIHCHNDMGLALANSLAAVEAGAEVVDVTVNGLGDRAGNCSIDECIIAIQGFYNIDLGVKTEKLYELSILVEDFTGIKRAFGKPLIGENAFTHKHDDDVKCALTLPGSTMPIEPSLVGNQMQILLGGEYCGPYTIAAKAEQMGFKLAEKQTVQVLKIVRDRLAGKKEPMADEEFKSIIKLFS